MTALRADLIGESPNIGSEPTGVHGPCVFIRCLLAPRMGGL